MIPVPGSFNAHIFYVIAAASESSGEPEMSEADWDKFEKDIEGACEQIP